MAILGNNTAGSDYVSGASPGRLLVSKFTLAAAGTLNELHGWIAFGTAGNTIRIVIYKDVGGVVANATLVAYTNPITISGSGTDTDLSQTGFSVPLPAGDYWIGVRFNTNGFVKGSTGSYRGIDTGSADPPPNPLGTAAATGTDTLSVWAVVGAAVSAFTPRIITVG